MSQAEAGKGSSPRPFSVSEEEYAQKWERIFGKKDVEKMVEAQQKSQALILTNPRKIWCKLTNEHFGTDTESDGVSFNDTNCYMITRPAFKAISSWGFKPVGKGLVGDRFFWESCIRLGLPVARCTQAQTNYSSDFACHYEMFYKPVPDMAKLIQFDGEKFVHTYHKDRK